VTIDGASAFAADVATYPMIETTQIRYRIPLSIMQQFVSRKRVATVSVAQIYGTATGKLQANECHALTLSPIPRLASSADIEEISFWADTDKFAGRGHGHIT
jgi:hypothetical protein